MKLGEQIGTRIHPTAEVSPTAEIGVNVEIGPYSIIGPDVVIGDGTVIESQVVIQRWTTIGQQCKIKSHVILGGEPQDVKFKGERSFLQIGDNNNLREFVTIHRATGEDEYTRIGHDNVLMAYCHIGHNCTIGNEVTMANTVGISGHVAVEDRVVFGGMVGVHQFVRIGRLAFIGGLSKVVQDVPPYMAADGHPARVYDVNRVGLRRAGIPAEVRDNLKLAHRLLYRTPSLNVSQALEAIIEEVEPSPEVDYLVEYIQNIKLGFGGRQLEAPRR
ncbi:MAG: acyl-ACP--UDP-N-acetylglucosamine O-acyltransferase [Armatimonadetes bacterium]|nr:acyl-ACP--UDP-N-acetylglucosamine O-acyltransferase [Armatimonadota bacterium]